MACSSLRSARAPLYQPSVFPCWMSVKRISHVFYSTVKLHRRRDFLLRVVSCHSTRRHHRRRYTTGFDSRPKELFRNAEYSSAKESRGNGSDDDRVVLTLDLQDVRKKAESLTESAKTSMHDSAVRAVRLGNLVVNDGRAFLEDLRSSISIQKDRRVVISLRRSSIEFLFVAVLWCLLLVTAWKLFARAAKKYRWGWEEGLDSSPVFKRDRSLGGREVFVGKDGAVNQGVRKEKQNLERIGRRLNPLDMVESSRSEKDMIKQRESRSLGKSESELPEWWPSATSPLASSSLVADTTTHENRASSILKMIMEKRSTGKDFEPDDILQLYQMNKYSGTSVAFDSPYSRDAFYRAAVNIALSSCGRSGNLSMDLGGDKAADFFGGLARSIRLDAERAATIVNAAIAAQTRSTFLQAWALFVQGKVAEAEKELAQLSYVLAALPPKANSPEMEMVAEGLSKHLSSDERSHLFDVFAKVSGRTTHKVAFEALGVDSAGKRP